MGGFSDMRIDTKDSYDNHLNTNHQKRTKRKGKSIALRLQRRGNRVAIGVISREGGCYH